MHLNICKIVHFDFLTFFYSVRHVWLLTTLTSFQYFSHTFLLIFSVQTNAI